MVSVLQNQPPIPSTPAPVARGQELSAQDLDLLGYPVVPLLPVTLPPPRQGGGGIVHGCEPLTHSVHTAASVPPTPGLGYNHQHPFPRPDCVCPYSCCPRHFAEDQQGTYPIAPTCHFRGEGEGLE